MKLDKWLLIFLAGAAAFLVLLVLAFTGVLDLLSVAPFFAIGLVLFIILAAVRWSIYTTQQRKEAFELLGREIGFTFGPAGSDLQALLAGQPFDLLRRGYSKKFGNTLAGRRRDAEVRVFDYEYTTGASTGKSNSRTVHHQTAVLFTLEGQTLPDFHVKPEGFFDKAAQKLGRKDINFDEDHDFSTHYQLTGSDELALLRLFNPTVRSWFQTHEKMTAEAQGAQLLVYRQGKRLAPEDVRQFLDDATQLMELMRRPTMSM